MWFIAYLLENFKHKYTVFICNDNNIWIHCCLYSNNKGALCIYMSYNSFNISIMVYVGIYVCMCVSASVTHAAKDPLEWKLQAVVNISNS